MNIQHWNLHLVLVLIRTPTVAEGSYELGSPHPAFRPSVFLSRCFLGIGSLVFSETQHGIRGPCVVVRDRARFFENKFFSQKWGKWAKNFPKIGFSEFIAKLSYSFFLKMVYKENLYYLQYSCTNPMIWKNLVWKNFLRNPSKCCRSIR